MSEQSNEMPPNQETMEKIARENFSTWNESLQTKDPAEVAKLYTKDATFLPTMSGDFKKGQEGAAEYFEHFLEKDPIGEVVDGEVQLLGPDSYLHSGMYNFEVGPEGERQVVEARFSYVWKKDEQGEWKVIHHHSSAKPQA